jgi:hypothetical protein
MANNRRKSNGLTITQVLGGVAAAGGIVAIGATALGAGSRSANVTLPNQIDSTEVAKIIKNDPVAFRFLRGDDGKNGNDGIDGVDNINFLFKEKDPTGLQYQQTDTIDHDIVYVLSKDNRSFAGFHNNLGVFTAVNPSQSNHILKLDTSKDFTVMFYVDSLFGSLNNYSLPKFETLAGVQIATLLSVETVKAAKGTFFVMRMKSGVFEVVSSPNAAIPESHDVIVLPENNTQVVALTEVSAKNVTIVLNQNSKYLADGTTPNHTLRVLPTVENLFFVIENNLFSTTTWCIPKVVNDADIVVEYYGSTTNSINRTWWESRYTGKTVRYKKYSNTSWGYIDSNTFTDILTRTATLVTADFQGTLMQNSIYAFTGSADLTVNLSTIKANLVKNRIYTIVNELAATKQLTVNLGEIPFNYTTATSLIVKRMDGSVSISPETTEFKGSLRFYVNNANKFVIL